MNTVTDYSGVKSIIFAAYNQAIGQSVYTINYAAQSGSNWSANLNLAAISTQPGNYIVNIWGTDNKGNTGLVGAVTLNYVIPFTVTFNSQGGSAVPGTGALNTTITKPTDPVKTGYDFGGWYKEAACTTAWTFATDTVAAATTLYAKWTPKTYTITFSSQGGSTVSDVTAAYNTTITKPTDPANTNGLPFGGWFKEASCVNAWNFAADKVLGPTTLYAKWDDT